MKKKNDLLNRVRVLARQCHPIREKWKPALRKRDSTGRLECLIFAGANGVYRNANVLKWRHVVNDFSVDRFQYRNRHCLYLFPCIGSEVFVENVHLFLTNGLIR